MFIYTYRHQLHTLTFTIDFTKKEQHNNPQMVLFIMGY